MKYDYRRELKELSQDDLKQWIEENIDRLTSLGHSDKNSSTPLITKICYAQKLYKKRNNNENK